MVYSIRSRAFGDWRSETLYAFSYNDELPRVRGALKCARKFAEESAERRRSLLESRAAKYPVSKFLRRLPSRPKYWVLGMHNPYRKSTYRYNGISSNTVSFTQHPLFMFTS